jgi:hypothetical protein
MTSSNRTWTAVLSCIVACACGRIRFDERGDSGLGDGDARIDAALDDATSDPSLLLWYPMDDDPADGAFDASGYGRNATCANGCPTSTVGQVNGGFAFAPMQHLELPSEPAFESITAFTVSLWIRVNTVGAAGYSGLAKTLGTTVENSWDLGTFSSNLPSFCTSLDGNSNSCDLAVAPGPVDTWFHLAGTWDSTTMIKTLYVDGVARTFSPRDVAFDNHVITLGCDDENGSLFACLDGSLDDVRIYNRALSATEIAALAN